MKKSKNQIKQKTILNSAPFLPNRGIEIAYAKKLKTLCMEMVKEYSFQIKTFYRENKKEFTFDSPAQKLKDILDRLNVKYITAFSIHAERLSSKMVNDYFAYIQSTFDKRVKNILPAEIAKTPIEKILQSAEKEYNIENVAENIAEATLKMNDFVIHAKPITPEIEEAMQVSIMENASLIKSLPPQYIERVSGAVTRAMQNGMSDIELAFEIAKYGKMTIRRAVNIAHDQSRKSYVALTMRKMQQYGFKKFKWLHVGGSIHPREYHLKEYPYGLNHGIFDMDNPPVIDPKTGAKGFPAQLPFCRCTMQAVYELEE